MKVRRSSGVLDHLSLLVKSDVRRDVLRGRNQDGRSAHRRSGGGSGVGRELGRSSEGDRAGLDWREAGLGESLSSLPSGSAEVLLVERKTNGINNLYRKHGRNKGELTWRCAGLISRSWTRILFTEWMETTREGETSMSNACLDRSRRERERQGQRRLTH
jgi:hypothetical protein